MPIMPHALVFLKIDVMGIITAISGVGKAQTSMRQGETDERNVTIHLLGLAAPISCSMLQRLAKLFYFTHYFCAVLPVMFAPLVAAMSSWMLVFSQNEPLHSQQRRFTGLDKTLHRSLSLLVPLSKAIQVCRYLAAHHASGT
jgi:hypothetical protein